MNGSPRSCEGDAIGVVAEDVWVLDWAVADEGRLDEPWRILEPLPDGEASRERVLRKVPFFFGGDGNVAGSSGSLGSLASGNASRSFPSTSTISTAVRVRVRLWVGAKNECQWRKYAFSRRHDR